MIVEIISTGTELLLGEIIDCNAPYLAQQFNALGFDVLYKTTVGDNYHRMKAALTCAINRADVIVTTGGLGPTQGDITKEVTADVLGLPMQIDEDSLAKIEQFFARRSICMPHNNVKQAEFAQGSIVLPNDCGTAPGMLVEHNGTIIINLPGPPQELTAMYQKALLPWLMNKYGQLGVIHSHTVKVIGLGESSVAKTLEDLITNQTVPTIALYARDGEILVRLTAKAEDKQQALATIQPVLKQVQERLNEYIFGSDEDTLEEVVGRELMRRGKTIALAESCSGGLVSSLLTDVAGSSAYLLGSVVSYSNQSKMRELDVPADMLAAYGAVSEQVACQMAKGISARMCSDIGVGITGIAGPGGGNEHKPVGLVYIAVKCGDKLSCNRYIFNGSRKSIKNRVAKTAILNILKSL